MLRGLSATAPCCWCSQHTFFSMLPCQIAMLAVSLRLAGSKMLQALLHLLQMCRILGDLLQ